MKKSIKKILFITTLIYLIFSSLYSSVYATRGIGDLKRDDYAQMEEMQQPSSTSTGGGGSTSLITPQAPSNDGGLSEKMGKVAGIAQYICLGIAVAYLLVLGTTYMTASPEGKANIKKNSIQYVIGAVIIFAAFSILTIIKSVVNSL